MLIENIIFWPIYALLWAAVVRYDVHMFQHNSYRTERYFSWFPKGYKFLRAATILLMTIAAIFSNPILYGVLALLMLIIAYREFRTTYKVPLAYTMRVKRLILTTLLLTLAVLFLAWRFIPQYMPCVALLLLTMPVLMLSANIVNRPVEAAISRWYYNDAKRILRSMPDLTIIGITGSFGKTSTKNYLYRILSEQYNVLMTPGNFNTTLGVVRTIREHLKPYHQIFIVEMGAKQTGDIKEICDLVHPTIGIVTAVGEMHLETFHSVDNIFATKFELIDALPKDGMGVINIDSEHIASRIGHYNRPCHVISYGVHNHDADYRAVNIAYATSQTSFDVDFRGEIRDGYATHLAGRGNILNLLAAIAVADKLGLAESLQKRAIRQIEQIEHRLSIKRAAGGVTILDDAYNSNPAGAQMALEVLQHFERPTSGRRVVVTPGFVELGERQEALNRELGRQIAGACDVAIIVNMTNRAALLAGLADRAFPKEQTIEVASLNEALAYMATMLRAGDVVLYENDLPDSFK